MPTLSEMASKGRENYAAKEATMKASYAAAGSRMSAGYDATPFGPTRKSNYKSAITRMQAHYRTDADKWHRNWSSKMAE